MKLQSMHTFLMDAKKCVQSNEIVVRVEKQNSRKFDCMTIKDLCEHANLENPSKKTHHEISKDKNRANVFIDFEIEECVEKLDSEHHQMYKQLVHDILRDAYRHATNGEKHTSLTVYDSSNISTKLSFHGVVKGKCCFPALRTVNSTATQTCVSLRRC